jgi:transcriptional regulator with XRE-family HTH domain
MSGRQYRYAMIRNAREERGMKIVQAARLAGISREHWWRLEHGKHASFELIRRASRILDLDWRDVVTVVT